MVRRVNRNVKHLRERVSGQHICLRDFIDLVAEELHAVGKLILIRRKNLYHVAAHTEGAAVKVEVISAVLDIDELGDDLIPILLLSRAETDHHVFIVRRAAEAVNAGDTRDNNHILPLEKGARRRIPKAVYLLVGRGILLDVGVRLRHIGLRLVVVVVGDKVLHRILREELLHLAVKLRRERLIVGDDERRLLQLLNHICHREGLTGTRHADQGLKLIALPKAFDQLPYGLRLVSRRLKLAVQFKFHLLPPLRCLTALCFTALLSRRRRCTA